MSAIPASFNEQVPMNRGRALAVARSHTGSIFIFLQDAMLAAKPHSAIASNFSQLRTSSR